MEYTAAGKRWKLDEGFGNHRFIVETEASDYVRTVLHWRRHDRFPERTGIRIRYRTPDDDQGPAVAPKEVSDIFIEKSTSDTGVIIFRAPEAGTYEIYYMPHEMRGHWYDPRIVYYSPSDIKANSAWLDGISSAGISPAEAERYESRTEFDSFYPMEMPMNDEELSSFFRKGTPFVTVCESRYLPVRMFDAVPFIWKDRDDLDSISDEVFSNEHYVFQVAVCAQEDLRDIRADISYSDGSELPAGSYTCFNLEGYDSEGNYFRIKKDAAKGSVSPLWIGIRTEMLKGEKHDIRVRVSASNTSHTEDSRIVLSVKNEKIIRNGDDDLKRMSRLFWLNSPTGISDDVIPPYTPVSYDEGTKSISILGRKIILSGCGLPEDVISYFNDTCLITDKGRNVLKRGIGLSVRDCSTDKEEIFSGSFSHHTVGTGREEIRSVMTSDSFRMEYENSYESDGHIDCMVRATALKDGDYSFTLSAEFYSHIAQYMMGLCREGSIMPSFWEYRWNRDKEGNHVWIGNHYAGIQIKLMQEWNFWRGPVPFPEMWYNDGKGTISVRKTKDEGDVLFRADTGRRSIKKGQTCVLHFHILITPFHPIDYTRHWTYHYYHKNSWHSDEPIPNLDNAKKVGASSVILHQGGPLNENINYPFFLSDKLKAEVDRAHSMGLKYKIYYTCRELSTCATELFALRSLGDEIFKNNGDFHIADFFVADKKPDSRPRGGAWLIEHLTDGFTAAWHQFLQNGEFDCAIATQGTSRWHNYYLEGLNWLIEAVGIDGIYLDGIGYDRHITKRLRRILIANGKADIDIHNGNEHTKYYGYASSNNIYMEHFPYADSLWNGEGFDHFTITPEYYLTEISGHIFGLMGEMLEQGGNPYHGMVFGMTTRAGWSQGGISYPIWRVWEKYHIEKTEMLGFWNPGCPVSSDSDNLRCTAYLNRDGDSMIAVGSWCPNDREYILSLDRDAFGIEGTYSLYAPAIEGVQKEATFREGEYIPVGARKGWLFVLIKE